MLAAIVHDVAVGIPGAVVTDAVASEDLVSVVAELHSDIAVVLESTSNTLTSHKIETLLCGGGRPVRVIILSSDGRDARMLELERNVTDLVDISADALHGAISKRLVRHG